MHFCLPSFFQPDDGGPTKALGFSPNYRRADLQPHNHYVCRSWVSIWIAKRITGKADDWLRTYRVAALVQSRSESMGGRVQIGVTLVRNSKDYGLIVTQIIWRENLWIT